MNSSNGSGAGGFLKLIVLGFVLAVLAVTLSEGLRDRVLDALFGAEEEFDYAPAPASAEPTLNGAAAAGERSSA